MNLVPTQLLTIFNISSLFVVSTGRLEKKMKKKFEKENTIQRKKYMY
jgi:hypothetical protein